MESVFIEDAPSAASEVCYVDTIGYVEEGEEVLQLEDGLSVFTEVIEAGQAMVVERLPFVQGASTENEEQVARVVVAWPLARRVAAASWLKVCGHAPALQAGAAPRPVRGGAKRQQKAMKRTPAGACATAATQSPPSTTESTPATPQTPRRMRGLVGSVVLLLALVVIPVVMSFSYAPLLQEVPPSRFDPLSLDEVKQWDADGSGFMSRKELKHLLGDLGFVIAGEELRDAVHEIDTDEDGKVSVLEAWAFSVREDVKAE